MLTVEPGKRKKRRAIEKKRLRNKAINWIHACGVHVSVVFLNFF